MKRLIIFSAVLLLAASTSYAQKEKNQLNVHLSYTPSFLVNCERYEYSGCSSDEILNREMMNGFNLGVGYAWNLWKKLFIETGGDLDFNFGQKTDKDGDKISVNFIDLRVPATVFYELKVTDGFKLVPLVGLDLGCGLLGEEVKKAMIGEVETISKKSYYSSAMGEYRYSRFILDWHVGCRFNINDKFSIGYTFMSPITNMQYHKETSDDVKKVTKAYRQNHFITFSYIF